MCHSVSHCWCKAHRQRRNRSPPRSCSGTAPQCWRPCWTTRCGQGVSAGASSTGRNAVALRRCHAGRAPGAPAFLLAGQCTRFQCTHSGKSTILSLLQRTHEFKGRCVKNKPHTTVDSFDIYNVPVLKLEFVLVFKHSNVVRNSTGSDYFKVRAYTQLDLQHD